MKQKNYKSMVFLLMLSCLYLYDCNAQVSINNQQQPPSTTQTTEVINIDTGIAEKQAEMDLLKNVHKLVIDAKRAGILDEETAKILMAYSILSNVSTQEAQKFLIAAELAGLSNQTRSVDFTGTAAANNGSVGERLAWVCCCSVLVAIICVLIYERSRNGRLEQVKRDLNDAMGWAYTAGEDAILKVDKAIRSFFANKRRLKK